MTTGPLTRSLVYLTLGFFVLLTGYPLVWLLFGSLKRQSEIFTNIWLWPAAPTFDNYVRAWTDSGIGRATYNSLVVTMSSVVLVLVIGSIAAYAFVRIAFPGRNVILAILILTLMIRPVFTSVELFQFTRNIGIIDTYPALILPYAATSLPLALALFAAYFRSIPLELEEAARIDGAGTATVFVRIVLPLSGPVLSAVAIFTFLDAYNELFMALVLLKDPELRTLSPALATLIGQFYKDFPELFAGLAASLIPVLAAFLILQRQFINGLLSGTRHG